MPCVVTPRAPPKRTNMPPAALLSSASCADVQRTHPCKLSSAASRQRLLQQQVAAHGAAADSKLHNNTAIQQGQAPDLHTHQGPAQAVTQAAALAATLRTAHTVPAGSSNSWCRCRDTADAATCLEGLYPMGPSTPACTPLGRDCSTECNSSSVDSAASRASTAALSGQP